jgi:AraC-like DNA-binding protein
MKLYIKYMVSQRCKMAVKEELRKLGIRFANIELGEVEVFDNITQKQREALKRSLYNCGLELMDDKRTILIEKVKNLITEMIHYNDELPRINYSDFISEHIQHDYTYLSNIFSQVKGITIQQFIINHKVERIKELISYGEMNLTEIAWKMNYSSVAHLSNQFKKITGFSPSHFKQSKDKRRNPIEEIDGSVNRFAYQ